MRAQTYREYTLLKNSRDQLSHLLCLVCQALGSILTEGNTVNATVINSLAWDSTMLKCVCLEPWRQGYGFSDFKNLTAQ